MDSLKIKTRSKKRRGQGYGSGKGGHTTGRGQKGQKTRSKIGILFEGVKVKKSLIKRLPFKRGKGKFKARSKQLVVPAEILNVFPTGAKIDLKALIAKKIVNESDANRFGVKVLGNGKITVKKLTVLLPVSGSVRKEIEKLGGKVESETLVDDTKEVSKNKEEKTANK